MAAGIITGVVVAGSGVALFARVRGAGGALVTRQTLASVAYQVSDLTAGLVAGQGTFPVATSVFDSLQQGDPRWTRDSATVPGADGAWGYNFLGVLPAALFPPAALAPPASLAAPHRYQADLVFTPATADQPFRVVFQFTPTQVFY